MSIPSPESPVDPVKSHQAPAHDIAAQVHAEYAKFLEKRDALRKSKGKLRRSALHTLLN